MKTFKSLQPIHGDRQKQIAMTQVTQKNKHWTKSVIPTCLNTSKQHKNKLVTFNACIILPFHPRYDFHNTPKFKTWMQFVQSWQQICCELHMYLKIINKWHPAVYNLCPIYLTSYQFLMPLKISTSTIYKNNETTLKDTWQDEVSLWCSYYRIL